MLTILYQIHLALSEWQNGSHIPGMQFTTDGFTNVYADHIQLLQYIWHENQDAYHHMMMTIFSTAYVSLFQTNSIQITNALPWLHCPYQSYSTYGQCEDG